MGKFADTLWYYMGVAGVFAIPENHLLTSEHSFRTPLFIAELVTTILAVWLCLRYRPAEPKRVALFGLFTFVGFILLRDFTGTAELRAPLVTLIKWVTALLFAHLFSIQRIHRKILKIAD
ncbi:hypothetical protein [Haladaptatus cibarius]|uniref:hypothetical protein n=1 Tax=Haladaptatus cibarius TaxID=453847 RepID=UPI000678A50E|nr:hypothetical protein [Haladaptatus cibarius]